MHDRPRPRWHHSHTKLDDFAIITWAVEPDRVRRYLPAGFEVDVRDGNALISMVPFRDRDYRFRAVPYPRMSCGQVNYRTYVRYRGETGVWFFSTALDSRLVTIPRVLWKMPWHRTELVINASWTNDGCKLWQLKSGRGGPSSDIELTGTGQPLAPLTGFVDTDDERAIVFDPAAGWYERMSRSAATPASVGRYSVWHEALRLEAARVEHARCGVFEDLDLISSDDEPLFAGVQRSVHFDIHTPPRRER